jgi:hypothetical protein
MEENNGVFITPQPDLEKISWEILKEWIRI